MVRHLVIKCAKEVPASLAVSSVRGLMSHFGKPLILIDKLKSTLGHPRCVTETGTNFLRMLKIGSRRTQGRAPRVWETGTRFVAPTVCFEWKDMHERANYMHHLYDQL